MRWPLCAVLLLLMNCRVWAQTQPVAPSTAPAGEQLVTLDFPADGVEIRTLAEIVSRRLGMPILYDETINNKRVILRAPNKVPESALLGILQSALRMKQMAMVDADQPGWKQIVAAQNLSAVARAPGPGAAAPTTQTAATAVTQVFTLRRADPARVVEAIRPMLTQPGGNAQPVPGQRILIVSDYATVVQNIGRMVETVDTDGPGMQVQFVPLKEAEANAVATSVTQLLTNRENFLFGGAGPGVFLAPDERTNSILVVAPPERLKEVVDLIGELDKPVELSTKVYRLKTIAPERVDRLVKDLLGSAAKRIYQSSVDRDSQSLVVSATPTVHDRITTLLKELDVPATAEQSPIRFYKLKNTKAADVLATIGSLLGTQNGEGSNSSASMTSETSAQQQIVGAGTESVANVPSNTPPQITTQPGLRAAPTAAAMNQPAVPNPAPQQPVQQPQANVSANQPGINNTQITTPNTSVGGQFVPPFSNFGTTGGLSNNGFNNTSNQPVQGFRTPNATVTADVNTNSIIVIAPPSVQAIYQELISKLDERRPQVQIECTIVTLDTSNGWSFGVDVGKEGGFGNNNSLISFSSFGIAKVDPTSGRLTPIDAQGGTFALLSPGIADVVLRALSSSSHARLVSAPQLLVNDNNKGQLHSVAVEPFAEILTNATQSITGQGGEAQAGTTIQVEPHISQDDYLQLDYSVELSNFTGQARSGLPPPRQENTVASSVTIPDGYTIVVGGLAVKNARNAADTLPIIGDIPIIGWLLPGSRSASNEDTTLFVFIRPVILRDDKFEDLKYLSDRKLREASLPPDFPQSEPIPLR
jgi:type II secretory pathway component GspD/PulD (secretin)